MRIIKILSIVFFLFLGLKAICQDSIILKTKEDTLQLLIQKITDEGGLSSPFVGPVGKPAMQYKIFIYLLYVANNDDLVKIINDNVGSIRLYAFMGLLYKKYDRLSEIKELLKNDTTKIGTLATCVVSSSTIKNELESISNWYGKEYIDTILPYFDKYIEFKNDYFEQIVLYQTSKELERAKERKTISSTHQDLQD